MMKRWWVRWYGKRGAGFEYHGPWWQSGWAGGWVDDDETPIFVAAVAAPDEDSARKAIEAAYDEPGGVLEWSFTNERPDDWAPFCDRFPRADWMRWPNAEPRP